MPWASAKEFRANYNTRFKHDPSSNAAMGYDATKLLADAIGRAKDETPDAIRQAIQDTKDFQGATGAITMDAERNADRLPVIVVQIKGRSSPTSPPSTTSWLRAGRSCKASGRAGRIAEVGGRSGR